MSVFSCTVFFKMLKLWQLLVKFDIRIVYLSFSCAGHLFALSLAIMQKAKFSGVDSDQSPEVQYLLKNLKLEELLPKARDAVNLFFLNIKANPQGIKLS